MKAKSLTTLKRMKRHWQIYAILLIPLVYMLIFDYGTMYGIQIAFRDYRPGKGITGSDWVGLKWFMKFLTDRDFGKVFWNTLVLSLYSFCTFPFPIILALIFNSIPSDKFRRSTQIISYVPHFISVTIMVGIVKMLLSPISGIYGNVYRLFGGVGYPLDFRALSGAFRHIYIWADVWQGVGWGSILYSSVLSSVPLELHEAARVDGASKLKRIIHIDIPSIMPTVGIMLILRFGGLIGAATDKVLLLQSALNLDTSEVIGTYVYKFGMNSFRNFSYGSAVGLFNTIINVALMVIVNFVSKKVSEGDIELF